VDITDPTAVSAGMDLLEQDAMPLQSMPLRARRVIVRLESATVVYHSTNLRVRTRTRSRDGRTAGSSRLRSITRSHVSGNAYRSPSCAALLASASALSRVPSRRSWGCRRWHTWHDCGCTECARPFWAEPRSTQVSVEALRRGFWHFGEFARAYKRCFGELPSHTLQRRPDGSAAARNASPRDWTAGLAIGGRIGLAWGMPRAAGRAACRFGFPGFHAAPQRV